MTYKSILLLGGELALLAGCSDLGMHVELTAEPEVSALAIDFGSVTVSDSVVRTITLRNSGRADAFGAVSVSCPGFRVVSGGGSFTLGPHASREVVVAFRPTSEGAFACSLDLGNEFPSVSLAGLGALQAAGARCELSAHTLDFGPVGVGQSAVASVDVSNTGTAPLLVNVVSPCSDFLVIQGGGAATIAPGNAITVRVLFNPLDGGSLACTLDVGPGCPTVSLTGFATTVSYSQDIAPIFNSRCNSCHLWSYQNTVGLEYIGPYFYIAPGDTALSEVYRRITGRATPRMPFNGPYLSPFQISKFANWILEGALNN